MNDLKITTAHEARALMPENKFNEELRAIFARIESAAKNKRASLRMGEGLVSISGDTCDLTDMGYSIAKALRSYGYEDRKSVV